MSDRTRRALVAFLAAAALLAVTGCSRTPKLEGYFLVTAPQGGLGSAGIYYASADGKYARSLLTDEQALSPRWDATGRRIYYTTDFGAGREVAAYDLTSNEILRITNHQPILEADRLEEEARARADAEKLPDDGFSFGGLKPQFVRYDLMFPSPTPDGRYVAYAVLTRKTDFEPLFRGRIFVTPAGGGRPHEVADAMFTPDWQPGGYVAVAGGGGSVLKHDFGIDPMSGVFEMSTDRIYADRSGQGEIQGARLSRDGSRVAWVQGQGLLVAPTDGSGEATVLATAKNFRMSGSGLIPSYVAWSPDGVYIAVVAGLERNYEHGGIFVFRADGEPHYGSTRMFQVTGVECRVDAFDWVASLD